MKITRELQKAVHENAVAHGWWESRRPDSECLALIHSELSEALEAYRDGLDPKIVYYRCAVIGEPNTALVPEQDTTEAERAKGKPEGIGIELADAVIRALDWAEVHEIDASYSEPRPLVAALFGPDAGEPHLPSDLCLAHEEVPSCTTEDYDAFGLQIQRFLSCVDLIAKQYNIDIDRCIALKHAYNKTRSYRHGGKLA